MGNSVRSLSLGSCSQGSRTSRPLERGALFASIWAVTAKARKVSRGVWPLGFAFLGLERGARELRSKPNQVRRGMEGRRGELSC